MEKMTPEAIRERAEVVSRLVDEVEAGRLTATPFERGYLAGSLATLQALTDGGEQPTP